MITLKPSAAKELHFSALTTSLTFQKIHVCFQKCTFSRYCSQMRFCMVFCDERTPSFLKIAQVQSNMHFCKKRTPWLGTLLLRPMGGNQDYFCLSNKDH